MGKTRAKHKDTVYSAYSLTEGLSVVERIALHREYSPDVRRASIAWRILEAIDLLCALQVNHPQDPQKQCLKELRTAYESLVPVEYKMPC